MPEFVEASVGVSAAPAAHWPCGLASRELREVPGPAAAPPSHNNNLCY